MGKRFAGLGLEPTNQSICHLSGAPMRYGLHARRLPRSAEGSCYFIAAPCDVFSALRSYILNTCLCLECFEVCNVFSGLQSVGQPRVGSQQGDQPTCTNDDMKAGGLPNVQKLNMCMRVPHHAYLYIFNLLLLSV